MVLALRSILFAAAFYVTTAVMLVFGSWLLIAPRSWAMAGLKLHGQICVWLLRVIAGTKLEVRGRENLPKGACLVVSKHQSAWDTFGLVPLFRRGGKTKTTVYVDRNDPKRVLREEIEE